MSVWCAGWVGAALFGAAFFGAGVAVGRWDVAASAAILGLCSGALAAIEAGRE